MSQMSRSHVSIPDSLSLSKKRHVDAVCLRFEAAWNSDQHPAIADFLVDASDFTSPLAKRAKEVFWTTISKKTRFSE